MLSSTILFAGGSLMKIERVIVIRLAFSVMAFLAAAFAGWLSPATAQSQNLGGALRALQGSPAAQPAGRTMSGEWSGKYNCRQGVTGVHVVLSEDGSRALFHFYGVPENPGVPEGCFTMSGSFDAASGKLNLNADKWIVRLRNHMTAGVSGELDASGQNFAGRIVGVSGCTNILMSRAPSPRPLPAACERALP
jgi:hypothetical protein